MKTMTRGKVALRTDVNVETVRYYEQRGLIPKPSRTASGYRQYTEDYVERIRFIKRAQELGFTLKEIKELLSLRVDPETDRDEVKQRAATKIVTIEEKISDLERMKHRLKLLVTSCSGRGPTSECPILEAMGSEESYRTVAD
ncbi:MAG: MerR family transcriptional regulator [Bacteroidetes bacterium]|nr:MerR family transcriptional regulator [Bacteroidota bacterium]